MKRERIPVARDRMFEQLPVLDRSGIAARLCALQRTLRGTYSVPGADFVLSVDAHHKLSANGIQV